MKYSKMTWGKMEAVINKLGGMECVEALLQGSLQITAVKHVVDVQKAPRIPFTGFDVIEHDGVGTVQLELRADGNLYANSVVVSLVLLEGRKLDNFQVYELHQELEGEEQLLRNSNVMDYLFNHPELIPKDWIRNSVYLAFFGTKFQWEQVHEKAVCYMSLSSGGPFRDVFVYEEDS